MRCAEKLQSNARVYILVCSDARRACGEEAIQIGNRGDFGLWAIEVAKQIVANFCG